MAVVKLKKIESNLQDVDVFDNPNISLEQYATPPHIAACMVHTIESRYRDISSKVIADLGCGCGVLSIACVMLDCQRCISYDIDPSALAICRQNVEDFDMDNIEVKQQDIKALDPADPQCWNCVDTVVMNPPFGTKGNKGIDMHFLWVALAMAKTAVYSLHKTATREHIEKSCADWGIDVFIEAQLRYNVDKTFKKHKAKSVDIEVDFIRFSFTDNKKKFKSKLEAKSEFS